MKPFSRADRVSGQIRKKLSELLYKEIKDPRLEGVVISGVKMSRDLKLATIYFTKPHPVSADDVRYREEAAEGFQSALNFIKRTLAQSLGLRYMPDFKFHYDESFEYGARIESLLKTLQQEKNGPDNSTS
ncbi:MAG: 30S ribosome-binding factor RbfA [Thermodesulfobacteriota bacterium]